MLTPVWEMQGGRDFLWGKRLVSFKFIGAQDMQGDYVSHGISSTREGSNVPISSNHFSVRA